MKQLLGRAGICTEVGDCSSKGATKTALHTSRADSASGDWKPSTQSSLSST